MTDEKSKNTGQSQDVPTVTERAESKSNFAKAAHDKGGKSGSGKAKPRKGGGKGWLWLLLFAAVLGGGGSWIWFNWPQVQSTLGGYLDFSTSGERERISAPEPAQESEEIIIEEVPAPEPTPAQSQPPQTAISGNEASDRAQQQANALRERLLLQQRTIAQLQQQLAELQRSVTAQGNRLGELGNVSRQDWQLAEADYLLRLANQRLMLERDSRAALALLEEVDSIVRQVDLPDLYGVRQQLARDITELKLVENIDRDGIYLRLRALEEQLLRTSIQPEFELAKQNGESDGTQPELPADATPWQRSWHNFTLFAQKFFHVRDGNIDPVLLSPQSEVRFRQSLRLNMEQAELALLREDTTVYRDSLQRVRQLLLDYGTASNQRDVLARELQELSELPIEAELPNLAASQSALRNYLERLHKTRTPTDGDDTAPGGDTQ